MIQNWLEYSLHRRAKQVQLNRADAKAQRSMLQRCFTGLRRAMLQAEEMADASEGFLQESQVRSQTQTWGNDNVGSCSHKVYAISKQVAMSLLVGAIRHRCIPNSA